MNDSAEFSLSNIKLGLNNFNNPDDIRITKKHENKRKDSILRNSEKNTYRILADSNFFKEFGYGRRIGNLNLQSMVISHNLLTSRLVIEEIGGFSQDFIGWGLEDTYFGAKAIVKGNFIIPVLSTGVYHIDHKPRSGSDSNKVEQYNRNLKIYNDLLKSII